MSRGQDTRFSAGPGLFSCEAGPAPNPAMTLLEAAALGTFGARDRRLLRAVLRCLRDPLPAEDDAPLTPRLPHEPLLLWACRCRTPLAAPDDIAAAAARHVAEAELQLRHAATCGICAVSLARRSVSAAARRDSRSATDPVVCAAIPAHLVQPAIAIVGSRAATPHGLEMARRLASDLARAGLVVIVGPRARHRFRRARGDARRWWLHRRGAWVRRSIASIPPEHAELARNMPARGRRGQRVSARMPPLPAPLSAAATASSAGCRHAVVVVEAPEKSGALITASAAAEQGRDVMVVPGAVANGPEPWRSPVNPGWGKARGVRGRYSPGDGSAGRPAPPDPWTSSSGELPRKR